MGAAVVVAVVAAAAAIMKFFIGFDYKLVRTSGPPRCRNLPIRRKVSKEGFVAWLLAACCLLLAAACW